MVSIPACHAGDRGSIPRRGVIFFFSKSTEQRQKDILRATRAAKICTGAEIIVLGVHPQGSDRFVASSYPFHLRI